MSIGLATRDWLDRRRPPPPPALLQRMTEAIEDLPDSSAPDVARCLGEAGLHCLAGTLRDGQDRSDALTVLAADGLLTYAFEAAAELGDPDPGDLARYLEGRRFACLLGMRRE